jgi:hypothetical protein
MHALYPAQSPPHAVPAVSQTEPLHLFRCSRSRMQGLHKKLA